MKLPERNALSVWIGFDPREAVAFAVARESVRRSCKIAVHGIVLDRMREHGLYWRPTEVRDGRLFDVISDHPMATQFAISRFLVPHLARAGWALFMDPDMMIRPGADLYALFEHVEREHRNKAVVCVKHDHRPADGLKMDGQVQTAYARKNWSSFCFFNVDHPANGALTLDLINERPGRDLHNFCWLDGEDQIGELPVEWNWLVGHSDPAIEPKNVHWTDGPPTMAGYEGAPYADEFRNVLYDWAR